MTEPTDLFDRVVDHLELRNVQLLAGDDREALAATVDSLVEALPKAARTLWFTCRPAKR